MNWNRSITAARRWAAPLLVALFLSIAPAADAATVSITGGPFDTTLVFQDDAAINNVTVSSPSVGTYLVEDTSDSLTASSGCARVNGDVHKVSCTNFLISKLHIDVAGLPDTVTVNTSTPAVIYGGTNRDTITGGSGDDLIDGQYGCPPSQAPVCAYRDGGVVTGDDLSGGDGDDTLLGLMGGGDVLRGGPGDDTLDPNVAVASTGCPEGCPNTEDILDGGPGADLLMSSPEDNYYSTVVADYSSRSSSVTVTRDGVANDGGTSEGDNVAGGIDIVRGGSGGDSLSGGAGPDYLEGRGGTDSLFGSGGDDILLPGSGIGDGVVGGDGNDTAAYGDRSANLSLSPDGVANDGASGENHNLLVENLIGGSGDDLLTGTTGSNGFQGGPGTDHLDYANHAPGIHASANGVADDGGVGEQDYVGSDIENISGTPGPDVIIGGVAHNLLTGRGGADEISGGGGDDALAGDGDDDVLRGDGGDDDLNGGSGHDVAWGGPGADGIDAGDGNDVLHGEPGADTLFAGTGNDTLSGELGDDSLDGGAGDDTADYSTSVALHESDCDENGFNCLKTAVPAAAVSADLATGTAAVNSSWQECDGWGCFWTTDDSTHTLASIEHAKGTPGDDVLRGTAARNVIDAGDGNDTVGGRGSNTSADALTGGTGTDTLDVSGDTGQSLTIDLALGTAVRKACQSGFICSPNTAQANLAGFENATGTQYGDTLKGTNDSNVLDGGPGADVITGFEGADSLTGGAGDDNLQARDNSADQVACGTNNDSATMDTLDTPSNCETVSVGQPPVASFTRTPSSPVTGQQVVFTSTSSDADGTITSTAWDLDDDGQYDDGTGLTAARTFNNNGTFPIRLKVVDNDGQVGTTTQTVTVANRPPVAAFNFSPSSPSVGQDVALTSTSSDPDGTVVAQAWDLDDDGQYDDATGASASRTFLAAGSHTVRLRVTDDDGVSSTTQQVVNVKSPPTAAFGSSPASPLTGQTVTFTSTSTDTDGTITSTAWDLDDDGQYDDATGGSASRSFSDDGTYTVRLRVTDNHGLTGSVSHTVTVLNRTPVAAFSYAPLAPQTGATVTFTSSSTDADGTVASVDWDLDDDGQYDDASGGSASRSFATPGPHTVGMRATDDDGGTATAAHSVLVLAGPSGGFGWTPSAPRAGEPVTFTSSSTDPDGSIVSTQWDLDGNGEFNDASGATVERSFPTPGSYTVRVRVTDNDGITGSAEHTVVVTAPDPGPGEPAPPAPPQQQQPEPQPQVQQPTGEDPVKQAVAALLGDGAVEVPQFDLGSGADAFTALTGGAIPYAGGTVLDPKLAIACLESSCAVAADATLTGLPGARPAGSLKLKARALKLSRGEAGAIKLNVPKKARKALKRAKKAKLVLRVAVTSGGKKTTAKRTYRLTRRR